MTRHKYIIKLKFKKTKKNKKLHYPFNWWSGFPFVYMSLISDAIYIELYLIPDCPLDFLKSIRAIRASY